MLEIGLEGGEMAGHRRFAKGGAGGEHLAHLLEVIRMVGSKMNPATGPEDAGGQVGEPLVDQSPAPMASLGPRIREVDVESLDIFEREQVLETVSRFDAQSAQIPQPGPTAFPIQLVQPPEHTFHAKEVTVGTEAGEFEEERAIARTQLDFDRARFGKDAGPIEAIDDRGQRVKKRRGLDGQARVGRGNVLNNLPTIRAREAV